MIRCIKQSIGNLVCLFLRDLHTLRLGGRLLGSLLNRGLLNSRIAVVINSRQAENRHQAISAAIGDSRANAMCVKLRNRDLQRLRHELPRLVDKHGFDLSIPWPGAGELHDGQVVGGQWLTDHCTDCGKICILGAEGGVDPVLGCVFNLTLSFSKGGG